MTKTIDRMFDFVDTAIGTLDHAASRVKPNVSRRASGSHTGAPRPRAPGTSTDTRIARTRWRVTEAIDASTGLPIFVVGSGADRCECNSRALAERVRQLLEGAP